MHSIRNHLVEQKASLCKVFSVLLSVVFHYGQSRMVYSSPRRISNWQTALSINSRLISLWSCQKVIIYVRSYSLLNVCHIENDELQKSASLFVYCYALVDQTSKALPLRLLFSHRWRTYKIAFSVILSPAQLSIDTEFRFILHKIAMWQLSNNTVIFSSISCVISLVYCNMGMGPHFVAGDF